MEKNGITILDPLPAVIDSFDGILLVLGGGKPLWEDYFKAKKLLGGNKCHVMCVNHIGTCFKAEQIKHFVSLHKGLHHATRLIRREMSMLETFHTHCIYPAPDVDNVWKFDHNSGTSGCFALKISVLMGYKKIILCGIPLDFSGHFFDPKNFRDNGAVDFSNDGRQGVWRQTREKSKESQDRVRSFSGNTMELFGEPTEDWLQ